jgi:hypothetical protein
MPDNVLIVFPPGGEALVRRLVEVSSLVSGHLTAIAFRRRAKRIQSAPSDAEKDEFATRQGLHDEEFEELSRLISEAARHANRPFHIIEDEPDNIADRVCIQSRTYPLTVMSLGDDLQAEFHLLSMVLYVAGRPVLVASTTGTRRGGRLERAVVAWNGTPQSARALATRPESSTQRVASTSSRSAPHQTRSQRRTKTRSRH